MFVSKTAHCMIVSHKIIECLRLHICMYIYTTVFLFINKKGHEDDLNATTRHVEHIFFFHLPSTKMRGGNPTTSTSLFSSSSSFFLDMSSCRRWAGLDWIDNRFIHTYLSIHTWISTSTSFSPTSFFPPHLLKTFGRLQC